MRSEKRLERLCRYISSRKSSHRENRRQANRRRISAVVETLEPRQLLAFTPSLVFDINQLGISSLPDSVTDLGGQVIFVADDGQTGSELWTTDGTDAGTVQILDVLPGRDGSQPSNLTVVGSDLFFTALDNDDEFDIWKTDGTSAGTMKVYDANDNGVYYPTDLTASGTNLFFTAYDQATGYELWVSDGTSAGTMLVQDINPVQDTIDRPSQLTDVNGILFFTSPERGYDNVELWKSDGTSAGTVMVAEVNPGFDDYGTPSDTSDDIQYGSYPANLTNVGGVLYFTAETEDDGIELFQSDGTVGGTAQVIDLNPGTSSSYPEDITAFNGQVFFSATGGTARRLYSTDGTAAGTNSVIDPVSGSDISNPTGLTVVGSELFFAAEATLANGANTVGRELFKTNGSAAGTTIVKDIVPIGSSNPSELTASNGKLYFSADDVTSTGREVWVSDGTDAGTFMLVDSSPGFDSMGAPLDGDPLRFTDIDGDLYFDTVDANNDRELWISDGTSGGTTLVSNINKGTQDSNIKDVLEVGGTVFFVADDGVNGEAVYSLDPATSVITLVADLSPASTDNINGLAEFDGGVVFFSDTSGSNGAMFSYGAGGGTDLVQLSDQSPVSFGDGDMFLVADGGAGTDVLYFVVSDATSGQELWSSSGGAMDAAIFVDLEPGTDSSFVRDLVKLGNTLYFVAEPDVTGAEVYRVSGPSAVVAIETVAGTDGSSPSQLTVSGGSVYFVADDDPTNQDDTKNGNELWRTSGTTSILVADIDPNNEDSNPQALTDIGGTLYFAAENGNSGFEPYVTTGTGVTLLGNLNPASNADSFPAEFTAVGVDIYFAATTLAEGRELWKTDGTAAGTALVTDLNPGATNSSPLQLRESEGKLHFTAIDSALANRELWLSDGTAAGTLQTSDLNDTPYAGSNADDFITAGGKMFFAGDNGLVGNELFELEVEGPRVVEVRVGSASWDPAFLNLVDPDGGDGFLVSTGANQLADVPFVNANQIYVQFDLPVIGLGGAALQPSDFQLIGSPTLAIDYQINSVTYDTETNTAKLTVDQFLTRDKLLLHVADGVIADQFHALDGEWVTSSSVISGNEVVGGAFNYRFDALSGNVNDDNLSNTTDLSVIRSLGTQLAGMTPGFDVRSNVNGDFLVNTTDISAIRNLGTQFLLLLDDPIAP